MSNSNAHFQSHFWFPESFHEDLAQHSSLNQGNTPLHDRDTLRAIHWASENLPLSGDYPLTCHTQDPGHVRPLPWEDSTAWAATLPTQPAIELDHDQVPLTGNPSHIALSRLPDSRHGPERRHRRRQFCTEGLCMQDFTRSADLRRHVSDVHRQNDKHYACNFVGCDRISRRKDKMKEHCQKVHKQERGEERFTVVSNSQTQ